MSMSPRSGIDHNIGTGCLSACRDTGQAGWLVLVLVPVHIRGQPTGSCFMQIYLFSMSAGPKHYRGGVKMHLKDNRIRNSTAEE